MVEISYSSISESPSETPSLLYYISIIIVLLGPFSFGLNLSFINSTKNEIEKYLKINSDFTRNMIITSYFLGGLFTVIIFTYFFDKISRIYLIRFSAFILLISVFFQILANNSIIFILGRILAGISGSLFLAIVPVYINEISPKYLKSICGALFQFFITTGILLNIVIIPYNSFHMTTEKDNNEEKSFSDNKTRNYVYGQILPLISALVILLFSFIIPFSPIYLFNKSQENLAIDSLKKLRSNPDEKLIDNFFVNLTISSNSSNPSFFSLFMRKNLSISLFVISLQFVQQFSGINFLLQFSSDLFEKLNFTSTKNASIILALFNVIGALISSLIIEKIGKRLLLILSIFICLGFYSILQILIVFGGNNVGKFMCLCFVIIGFNIGLGPVPWMIPSFYYDDSFKASGNSLNTISNLFFTILISVLSSFLIGELGNEKMFIPFIVILGVFGIGVIVLMKDDNKENIEVQNEVI